MDFNIPSPNQLSLLQHNLKNIEDSPSLYEILWARLEQLLGSAGFSLSATFPESIRATDLLRDSRESSIGPDERTELRELLIGLQQKLLQNLPAIVLVNIRAAPLAIWFVISFSFLPAIEEY